MLSKLLALAAGLGGSSVQPDWNQNDPNAADYVKNRTHYGSKGDIAWDETFADSVGFEFLKSTGEPAGGGVKKVSDQTPNIEEVLKNGHVDAEKACDVTEDSLINVTEKGYAILLPARRTSDPRYPAVVVVFEAGYEICYAYKNGEQYGGKFLATIMEPGIYFYQTDYGSAASVAYSFSWDALKPLDEAYIPDTIARKSDLAGAGCVEIVAVSCETADMQTFTNAAKDKSYTELKAAYDAGKLVWCRLTVTIGTNVAVAEAPLAFVAYDADMVGMNFSPLGIMGDQGILITIDSNDGCAVVID